MSTVVYNEDGKERCSQNGTRLVRLDDEWAYDLFPLHFNIEHRISQFRTSWYHRCLNSNMFLRCDYIKNVNKYFARKGEFAQIQYANKTIKEPICVHCFKSMPNRYARMFQLYWLGTRIKLGRNPK